MTDYDVLVLGAGHNGLVAAIALARAGQSVLVVERQVRVGGMSGVEVGFPGFSVPVGATDLSLLRPEVFEGFGLDRYNLEFLEPAISTFVPETRSGPALRLHGHPGVAASSLAEHSAADAQAWPGFLRDIEKVSKELEPLLHRAPTLLDTGSLFLRPELLRLLSLSADKLLSGWFEGEKVRGALAWRAVFGNSWGPRAHGTGYNLLYQLFGTQRNRFAPIRRARGGMAAFTSVLHDCARSHGVDIFTASAAESIVLEKGRAIGVELAATRRDEAGREVISRSTLTCDAVFSSIDPAVTLLDLVGAPQLPPSVVRKVRSARYRGRLARVDFLIADLPRFLGQTDENDLAGEILLVDSPDDLERAADDAGFGRVPDRPCLRLVSEGIQDETLRKSGRIILTATVDAVPSDLNQKARGTLMKRVQDRIEEAAPGFSKSVEDVRLSAGADWVRDWNLTEGSPFHGEMGFDQSLIQRPFQGYAAYQSPVEGLYLCGSGCHPGGGVTGLPGLNAVKTYLEENS